MEKESLIREQKAKWVGSHKEFISETYLRGLANLVNTDFELLPKIVPTHKLISSGICQKCNGTGISSNEFDDAYIIWGGNILMQRPEADSNFDQAPVSYIQAFNNIAYIIANISNETSFAFIGDDDFHSLLLAKLLPNLKITVFEADERIITKIKELAKKESLNINVENVNMIENIPSKYHKKFDAFYTDPPYSKKGIFLFLFNGLLLLKNQITSWGILAIPFTSLPLQVKELIAEVQLYLLKQGIIIDEVIPFFKKSPSKLGIISGILKFQLISGRQISEPPIEGDLYEHFY